MPFHAQFQFIDDADGLLPPAGTRAGLNLGEGSALFGFKSDTSIPLLFPYCRAQQVTPMPAATADRKFPGRADLSFPQVRPSSLLG